MSDYEDVNAAQWDEDSEDSSDPVGRPYRLSYEMDLSSSLPEQPLEASPIRVTDSYTNALSTLQGAKALLLSTADARTGLNKLQKENTELEQALEDQTNIQNLNDIQQMRKFYDDVTTGSARVDARIRAIESVQWLDLDEKYGIRRQNLLGESRNMRAIEEKAMRANAMAALRHYLGEFQVKKIKNQLESADTWFGAQEKRLKEEILRLNPDGTSSTAEAQRLDLIEAALARENIDPNLSKVFSERGNGLAEATARIYKSFALWVGRAKQQLEQTKLESAAASKHLKSRLLSTEAEASYLKARVAELEASVATSGADEAGIKADIAAKYISTRNSLQEQISQLRDRIEDVRETITQDKEEIAGAKKMASSLRNYDPLKPVDETSKDIDDRESIFKEYIRQLTTKDNAANDRLQKQIDKKVESLRALATAEAEVKERIAAAQACSRTSVIALDKHKMKAAADRNALEIMFKALTGKKENLDKKIARAEERAAVKTRSVQIKDKNTAVLKNLSDSNNNNRRTVHAGTADGIKRRVTPGHRSTMISKASASLHRQPRLSTRAAAAAVLTTVHKPQSSLGRNSVLHSKNNHTPQRKKSKAFFPDDRETPEMSLRCRKSSVSSRRGSLRRDSSNDSCSSDNAAPSGRRKSVASAASATSTVQGSNDNLTTSLPLAARRSSFNRRNSKELRRPSFDAALVKPRPPSEEKGRKNSFRGRLAGGMGENNSSTVATLARAEKPPLFVNTNSASIGAADEFSEPCDSLGSHIDSTMEPISEFEEVVDIEEPLDAYTFCGKSQSALLAGVYSYFIVDLRLRKLVKDMPEPTEEVISPPTPDTYKKKFESVKSALPKDVYYRNKRKSAPMRRRMFSSDEIDDEALVENPLVKYLVIDESYSLTYDFTEAMITVNRCVGLLQNLGYLEQPTLGNSALCNLYSYFNVEFLFDDFEETTSRIRRPVYSFAMESSAKIWRRYQESLQAIRYQDNYQKEDELRRFCFTIVKYSIDTFVRLVDCEQKYLKSDYSLTVRETDANVWLRMAEVINVIFGSLAVVVNCTFKTEFEKPNNSEDEGDTKSEGIETTPPPTECGLGINMNVYLNRASEHAYSAICLANGMLGKTEAANSVTAGKVGVDEVLKNDDSSTPALDSARHDGTDEGDTRKVLGQDYYPLSFVRTTGFFFTLYRAAFMTSMVNNKTRSPFFGLLYEWIMTYFPNNWKESWVSHSDKSSLKKMLLRDVQVLRAFSSYFYFTGLGVDVMDLEEAENCFKSELETLSGCSDIAASAVVTGNTMDEPTWENDKPELDSPTKVSRRSISNKGGICCHDVPWNALISSVIPPALPILTILRMILKFSFKQIKILGVNSIDTIEFKQECHRMSSFHKDLSIQGSHNLSEIESIVAEYPIPVAQKSTYVQLGGLCRDLMQVIEYQISDYEEKLRRHEEEIGMESIRTDEDGTGMGDTAKGPSQSSIDAPDMCSGAVGDEPFVANGDLRILDLPYGMLKQLESILREMEELSRSIARGTKSLAHMVAIRIQSLLESLYSVMSSIKMHRKKAEAWLERKKHDAELHDLVSGNRRSIIGMCEALLDACGVSIDHALASTQLEKAELSCERIRSARRKIKFSDITAIKPESTSGPVVDEGAVGVDIVEREEPVDSGHNVAAILDALQASVQALRFNLHPEIKNKLMKISEGTPGDQRKELEAVEDDMAQCKNYLTEQMSVALVQYSHWKREWDEMLEEEKNKQLRSVEHATSPEKNGVDSVSGELNEEDIRPESSADILLSDILGVSGASGGGDIDQVTGVNFLSGRNVPRSGVEDGVVSGTQWRLTRGVLKTGEDVLAGSTA